MVSTVVSPLYFLSKMVSPSSSLICESQFDLSLRSVSAFSLPCRGSVFPTDLFFHFKGAPFGVTRLRGVAVFCVPVREFPVFPITRLLFQDSPFLAVSTSWDLSHNPPFPPSFCFIWSSPLSPFPFPLFPGAFPVCSVFPHPVSLPQFSVFSYFPLNLAICTPLIKNPSVLSFPPHFPDIESPQSAVSPGFPLETKD